MENKRSFSGGLDFIGLADLIQILGGNGGTGVLKLTSEYASSPGYIYFVDGDPVHAAWGEASGVEALYGLFGLGQGQFEFRYGPVQVGRTLKRNRMQLVLDGLRMMDEGKIRRIGPTVEEDPTDGFGYGNVHEIPVVKGPIPDYMYIVQEEGFSDGTTIVREGAYGNWIWVILEGLVDITKETPQGPIHIARLGEGCFIGTLLSLLHGVNRRTATATAVGDVQLGLLDTVRLSGEYAALSPGFRGVLLSLTGRLFKITDRTVGLIMRNAGAQSGVHPGSPLMEDELLRRGVYTIRKGGTWVVSRMGEGFLPLCSLVERDVFGSVPFLDIGHEPRGASVVAPSSLEVERLDSGRLQKEYDRLSETFRSLVHNVGTCISETTRIACRARTSA
ncbi:MAG: DUF4388 domain-containing protein [Desulfobacteraceae bacterium]